MCNMAQEADVRGSRSLADNPLVLKLSSFMDLTPSEKGEIEGWCGTPTKFAARQTLIHQGDRPKDTCLMLSGWAFRHKILQDGTRQIVGLLLPGDMCDLHGFLLRSADHDIAMINDAVAALIPAATIEASLERQPRLMRALWWSSLVDEGIVREWLVSLGRRQSPARLAHLLCELWMRLHRVGIGSEDAIDLPLSQIEMADMLGLTSVHVNRTIKVLREAGLVAFNGRTLSILHLDGLSNVAGFDPSYLQLKRPAVQPSAGNPTAHRLKWVH